ncbi:lipopolysaccharide assembly protein LapB [Parahalioglobus pacificus]|uniref:Lipopolysaccharide assembly protein B n=1 Tax=Parahalioglobus pacificus TaxID=930806 RepID=A0A918XCL0_9GAMM|nr:lipopolysaccharide assembly protein LapB [Halioglobus pacificus]NQY02580.1 lipopolysaccharide assembly protein LapB [Halieaceae bacterium]GHD26524.1 lipopolysaccharide assembly protein B [Halioglobus pacificus]
MNDVLVFGLLFAAIAIGWFLGRRQGAPKAVAPDLPSQYYKGLNYLLDGRQDGAVDAFINALEVNSETLETHIALGNLLRKKGEVARAIRIHQNLLARPSLPRSQVHQAHLELARDYISAGLLDRAERLLLDLVQESTEQRRASHRHLLDIYQSERDWPSAIAQAEALLPRKSLLKGSAPAENDGAQPVPVVLAHLHCELAQEALERSDLHSAREELVRALARDKDCVRASLLLGDVERRAGNTKLAVKTLRKVRHQDADFVPETIEPLRQCYAELGDRQSLRQYLRECLEQNPVAPVVLALAEDLLANDGEAVAREFLTQQLSQQPSLRGLGRLISLQQAVASDPARENLEALYRLVEQLVAERPLYRCSHCGFTGQQLHWFCPGCKYWGTVRTLHSHNNE